MSTHTVIVRGVLPVALAVASLLTPFATAVASEPSVTGDDATATDTSLTEPTDDATSTTIETSDTTTDTATGATTDTTDATLDDESELTGTVDDGLETGEELTEATVSEVEEVLAPPDDDDGGDGSDPEPAAEDGSADDQGSATGPQEDAEQQPAPGEQQDEADPQDQGSAADAPAAAPRSPVPPPPSPVGAGEPADTHAEPADAYAELFRALGDEPPLPPRAQVDPVQPAPPSELTLGMAELTYSPSVGQRSTAPIMDILRRTRALPSTTARIMAPFPVTGLASYSDDWGAPRHPDRVHRGVDIFAERGTPVIASMDGEITGQGHHQGLGGNWLRLEAPDGTYLYYAHLDAFAAGVRLGVSVTRGQALGTVGTSGNARGTPPHLHLQLHPGGGAPVPPLPYLDSWLDQAYQSARSYEASGGGVLAPQVAPPATAEIVTESDPAGSEVPVPAGSAAVQAGHSYALDPASTSTGGPAALGLGVIGVIAWVMLRRPRRRNDDEADGFIDLGVAPTPTELAIRRDAPQILELPSTPERPDRGLVGARTP